mmetsp:Transcript_11467/g.17205  ORF Transcript_11467/g.17205 Transcript_11467/m.17205 type:complete len:128 (-) Transcript_11467:24-407(-)
MASRKEVNATVDNPSAAKIARTTDAWIGSERVFIPDGDGSAQPSGPIPAMAIGSGSGIAFLLKNAEVLVLVFWNDGWIATRRADLEAGLKAAAFWTRARLAISDVIFMLDWDEGAIPQVLTQLYATW